MPDFWQHEGDLYEFLAMYSLPNDAWSLELTKLSPDGGMIVALVPDEDLSLPVRMVFGNCEIPLTVLRRFLAEVDAEERRLGRVIPPMTDLDDTAEPTGPHTHTKPDRPVGSG